VAAAAAFSGAVVALPFAVGFAARSRRETLAAVEARLEQAERERDERARRAVLEDRARLAAELHDVVAHHVSLIGVQAGAARVHLHRDPDVAAVALAAVEDASRAAVGEMRRILDVLDPREGESIAAGGPRAPVPTVAQLDALATEWRRAGLNVELALDPAVLDPGALSVDRSACVYRIVEEAITNVARHSTAGRVRVVVGREPGVLVVRVADPGPARRPGLVGGGGGRGLDGARRRVDLFGGTFAVGPDGAGGFGLEARIPQDES
jgi:signal transduction histidine kinase